MSEGYVHDDGRCVSFPSIFHDHGGQKERDLFPYLWEPIQYSLTILFVAFALAILVALCLTIMTMLCNERIRIRIKFTFYLLETLPDLLIILCAQFTMIAF